MQKKNIKKTEEGGYTIIEMMIAISIFLVIVTIGIGALLNANLLHTKSQNVRSLMDNLSFVIEDMSTNIRTGSKYHCNDLNSFATPQSCTTKSGIFTFLASDNNTQVVYIILGGGVQKSINGNSGPLVPVTSSEIYIDPASSGFIVSGAELGDKKQPLVTIRLIGKITDKSGFITPFSLQTSVSQRLLDRN